MQVEGQSEGGKQIPGGGGCRKREIALCWRGLAAALTSLCIRNGVLGGVGERRVLRWSGPDPRGPWGLCTCVSQLGNCNGALGSGAYTTENSCLKALEATSPTLRGGQG